VRENASTAQSQEEYAKKYNGLLGEKATARLVKTCVRENASTAQSQEEYAKKYNGLLARYEKATARLAEVSAVSILSFLMVELRGIEPLSENNSTGLSPGEVCYLHSLAEA
jgi:hypothetical protein